MRKGIRQTRHCHICQEPVKEYWYNGRFKSYAKTCKEHCGYDMRRGELNPSWKGGRLISKDGYILVLDSRRYEKRGVSRYILEHRLIAEQKVGRVLRSDEIVHHLNGIRNDNREENLVIINGPNGHETWTFSKLLQERIRELEVKLKECQQ